MVLDVAAKAGKTAAQVLVRWGIQKGLCVCVKSANPHRMRENLAVGDFELDANAVASLDALTTDDAVAKWRAHYEKRRAGTPAPWGEGPRPAS